VFRVGGLPTPPDGNTGQTRDPGGPTMGLDHSISEVDTSVDSRSHGQSRINFGDRCPRLIGRVAETPPA